MIELSIFEEDVHLLIILYKPPPVVSPPPRFHQTRETKTNLRGTKQTSLRLRRCPGYPGHATARREEEEEQGGTDRDEGAEGGANRGGVIITTAAIRRGAGSANVRSMKIEAMVCVPAATRQGTMPTIALLIAM